MNINKLNNNYIDYSYTTLLILLTNSNNKLKYLKSDQIYNYIVKAAADLDPAPGDLNLLSITFI